MIPVAHPDILVSKCQRLARQGNRGVLISGGCDTRGRLPWASFLPAIRRIKKETDLHISVHSGIVDDETACRLKESGVDQALIDVVGDNRTYREVCHADFGISRISASLAALNNAGLPVVPHVVCGLHYGKLKGEWQAVKMIAAHPVAHIVIVSLMRLPGMPVRQFCLPNAEDVADVIAFSRSVLPSVSIGLGCARERGNYRMERLAIDAGVTRMALPSQKTIQYAMASGFDVRFQNVCCSVGPD